MTLSTTAEMYDSGRSRAVGEGIVDVPPMQASAVSWGAILAGAAAAAALSLILLLLGAGLGLSSVSPWSNSGISAATFGISTVVWITVSQVIAAGMGGYLAGRLRTRWLATHTDEVYFRDTAHGFLAWAVASLATAALLTSVIGSIVSGGVQAGATVAGSVAATGVAATAGGVAAAGSEMSKSDSSSGLGPMAYFVDSLFRRDPNAPAATGAAAGEMAQSGTAGEVLRIFMNAMRSSTLPADDVRYLGQLVAQRTGLSQQDAEKRVTDTFARAQTNLREAETAAKAAADKARKVSAYATLWLFISLLCGAFVASWAATFGGRRRDNF